jgi:hypothetical protein
MAGKPLPREHGTMRGYKQHEYNKEPKCQPCLDARAALMREHRKTDSYQEYRKDWYSRNRDRNIERAREWKQANKERVTEYVRNRYSVKKDEINAQRRETYHNNEESRKKKLERHRRWAKANPDKINQSKRNSRQKNLDVYREKRRAWYQQNKEKIRTVYRRKRNDRYGYGFLREAYSTQEVIDTYGSDCHICSDPIDLNQSRKPGVAGWENALHIDHVIPLVSGGPDRLDNVRPAHAFCNLSKGAKIEGIDK